LDLYSYYYNHFRIETINYTMYIFLGIINRILSVVNGTSNVVPRF